MTDAPDLPTETTPQGKQIVAPGVRPITLRDRLAVRAALSMTPRRNPNARQKPCNVGLFDEAARNQLDMIDLIRAATRGAPNPEHLKEN